MPMYNNPNKYRLGLFNELMDDVQGFVDISEIKVNDMAGAFMPNMEVMHLCLWSGFSRIIVELFLLKVKLQSSANSGIYHRHSVGRI